MPKEPRRGAPDGAFRSGPLTLADAALLTDLYEIAMAQSYWREGMRADATFSLFSRRLPEHRGYLVAAGLDDVLTWLQDFRFTPDAIAHLGSLGRFAPEFLDWLSQVRFTGTVRAVPEGTLVFADEPLLEVTAPIVEAQLVESLVLNAIHFQTLIATKAARCVDAARGRPVIEFGLRRTPGVDAGLRAARAAWIGGAASTSNVLAGHWLGIPASGTMAHSYVTAFDSELDAFRAFARAFPSQCILLIDTYDTLAGARKAVLVGQELARDGHRLAGVRLDSGDLAALSRVVRAVLDEGGLPDATILASGGLDEFEIERLVSAGAPIDAFGVGTRMDVSSDAPYLDMAYKMVRYQDRDVLKLSGGKETLPGAKQVWRDQPGDTLGLADEPLQPGTALLEEVMRSGCRTGQEELTAVRARCRDQIAALPQEIRRLRNPGEYPVHRSAGLERLRAQLRTEALTREVGPWTA